MVEKASTRWRNCAGRDSTPIRFPDACLSSAAGVRGRSASWLTTVRGFWLATKRLSKGRFRWWPTGREASKNVARASDAVAAGGRESGNRSGLLLMLHRGGEIELPALRQVPL